MVQIKNAGYVICVFENGNRFFYSENTNGDYSFETDPRFAKLFRYEEEAYSKIEKLELKEAVTRLITYTFEYEVI